MKPNHLYETSTAIVVTIALLIGAAEFYWLRELLVALLILALISGAVWMVVLAVFFVQQEARKGLTNLERSLVYRRPRVAATSAQVHAHPRLRSP
jgi:hypothetical protein